MAVYTVHESRRRRRDTEPNLDRFVFVRDGFYFWAFLLGPLWMIWRGLWLVLFIYAIFTVALQAGLWVLGVSATVKFAVGFLIALLIGFEAATLRRWTLRRRKNHGVVVAPNLESAERRFFDSWMAHGAPVAEPTAAPPAPTPQPAPQGTSDVIGLFPEPQSRS
jgi:hypothetical protein